MKNCPRCNSTLKVQDQCEYCDWIAGGMSSPQIKRKASQEDRQNRQCTWNDYGRQCDIEGHLSHGTDGSGPWFCRQHFWHDEQKHKPVDQKVGKENTLSLRAILDGMKKQPGRLSAPIHQRSGGHS